MLYNFIVIKSGFLFIDKEDDFTSSDVDRYLRKNLQGYKAGHLGTLDPFATGLLIVGINDGCKFLPLLDDSYKTYIAKLKLGEKTDTADNRGTILERRDVRSYSKEEINAVLKSFLGKNKQMTPMYSARHKDGIKLYQLARKGITVSRDLIDIDIKEIELSSYEDDIITFKASVSKGTYIRTLGEDIASRLDTIGHLISLRRMSIGKYDVSIAKRVREVKEEDIIPITSLLKDIREYQIEDYKLIKAENGNALHFDVREDQLLVMKNDRLIALYKRDHLDVFKAIIHTRRCL